MSLIERFKESDQVLLQSTILGSTEKGEDVFEIYCKDKKEISRKVISYNEDLCNSYHSSEFYLSFYKVLFALAVIGSVGCIIATTLLFKREDSPWYADDKMYSLMGVGICNAAATIFLLKRSAIKKIPFVNILEGSSENTSFKDFKRNFCYSIQLGFYEKSTTRRCYFQLIGKYEKEAREQISAKTKGVNDNQEKFRIANEVYRNIKIDSSDIRMLRQMEKLDSCNYRSCNDYGHPRSCNIATLERNTFLANLDISSAEKGLKKARKCLKHFTEKLDKLDLDLIEFANSKSREKVTSTTSEINYVQEKIKDLNDRIEKMNQNVTAGRNFVELYKKQRELLFELNRILATPWCRNDRIQKIFEEVAQVQKQQEEAPAADRYSTFIYVPKYIKE